MTIRVTDAASQPVGNQPEPPAPHGYLRPLLWLLLVITATANVVTSTAHLVALSVGFGVLTLALGVTLAVHHYRRRRK